MQDFEKFLLQWESHEKSRTPILENLWRNDSFVDVSLACDDDQGLRAHQIILSVASPVFRKILQSNPKKYPFIYLKGTRKQEIETLLEFIYCGKTEVRLSDLENFIELAKAFEIKGVNFQEDMALSGKNKLEQKKRVKKEKYNESYELNEAIEEQGENLKETLDTNDSYVSKGAITEDEKIAFVSTNDADEKDLLGTEELLDITFVDNEEKLKEYKARRAQIVHKKGDVWTCSVCLHTRSIRTHLLDHAEKHIKGFSFECDTCDKSYSSKNSLRCHKKKCPKTI